MANPNWTRWIKSSVSSFFEQLATDVEVSLPFIVEGLHERTAAFMESTDRVEIRINGPFSKELSVGYHRLFVDVNCLFLSRMDGAVKNIFELDRFLGIWHEAMDGPIPIYRHGTGPDDDGDLLGCLRPRPGKNDAIRVLHFGQVNTVDRLREGMVDARYVMYLND